MNAEKEKNRSENFTGRRSKAAFAAAAALAFVLTCVCSVFVVIKGSMPLTFSIWTLFLWAGFLALIWRGPRPVFDRRRLVFSGVFGALFGVLWTAGYELQFHGYTAPGVLGKSKLILCGLIVGCPAWLLMYGLLGQTGKADEGKVTEKSAALSGETTEGAEAEEIKTGAKAEEAEETKSEETKSEEAKAEEGKAEEAKAEEAETEEAEAEEAEAEEAKAEEAEAEEAKAEEAEAEEAKAEKAKAEKPWPRWKVFVCSVAAIWIMWIPVWLAYYPVIMSYDFHKQSLEALLGPRYFNNHHPIAHTWLIYQFRNLGLALGSFERGFAWFCLFQQLVTVLVLGYAVWMICKLTRSKILTVVSVLFYGLFPLVSVFVMCTTKDVLFGAFFLLFILLFAERMLAEKAETGSARKTENRPPCKTETGSPRRADNGSPHKTETGLPCKTETGSPRRANNGLSLQTGTGSDKKKEWGRDILWVLSGILMMLFRNNAFYAMCIFAVLYLILCGKGNRLRVLILMAALLLGGRGALDGLQNLFHAHKGSKIEKYSVVYQTMARVGNRQKDVLSGEEAALIDRYVTRECWADYNPSLADTIKSPVQKINFGEKKSWDNMGEVFGAWVEIGTRYPNDYIDAFLDLTRGYWFLDDTSHAEMLGVGRAARMGLLYTYNSAAEESLPGMEHVSKFPWLEDRLENLLSANAYYRIPLFSNLFKPAFWCWLLMGTFAVFWYRKEKGKLLLTLYPLCYFGTMLLGPTAIVRYVYQFILLAPVLIALVRENTA